MKNNSKVQRLDFFPGREPLLHLVDHVIVVGINRRYNLNPWHTNAKIRQIFKTTVLGVGDFKHLKFGQGFVLFENDFAIELIDLSVLH